MIPIAVEKVIGETLNLPAIPSPLSPRRSSIHLVQRLVSRFEANYTQRLGLYLGSSITVILPNFLVSTGKTDNGNEQQISFFLRIESLYL